MARELGPWKTRRVRGTARTEHGSKRGSGVADTMPSPQHSGKVEAFRPEAQGFGLRGTWDDKDDVPLDDADAAYAMCARIANARNTDRGIGTYKFRRSPRRVYVRAILSSTRKASLQDQQHGVPVAPDLHLSLRAEDFSVNDRSMLSCHMVDAHGVGDARARGVDDLVVRPRADDSFLAILAGKGSLAVEAALEPPTVFQSQAS
eukprot:3886037-Rhodomonas_salina.1